MAGGVAAFDYNNDGRIDLFFANGADLPSLKKTGQRYSNRLYRNDGAGHFTDVTEGSGLAGSGYAIGAAAADFDNDGLVDLFVSGVNESHTPMGTLGRRMVPRRDDRVRYSQQPLGCGRRLVRLRSRRAARSVHRQLREMVA